MKVYKIWTETYWYDEYDACVIIAENEEEALSFINVKRSLYEVETVQFTDEQMKDLTIEEISLDKAQVVLASFNAG